jgi:oxygen-independent coproporphyrinogen-3 oxidase
MQMDNQIQFDEQLIRKYNKAGPRYTSYPTAVQFHSEFGAEQYRQKALESNESGRPLSLYFHLPFCDTVCFFCGCNKIITKNRRHSAPYLENLHREIELQSQLFSADRDVRQLHWGGGTPTFITPDQMRELMVKTGQHFKLLDDDQGEYSIEIDPREANPEIIKILREIGFNRLSMGVQDFNPIVQKAVNRIQPREVTLSALQAARDNHFKSISVDLIYGLPEQTQESFGKTVDEIIEADPDRISVFNYAHMPELFKVQRQIDESRLPSAAEKLDILKMVIEKLTAAGYIYIGMDHFAKPEDELALAQKNGSLYRNFQGYSTHADCDMVSMGITSIGQVGNSYSQNVKTLEEYDQQIKQGEIPIFRGIELSKDDLLRRAVITQLICNFTLNFAAIESEWEINFQNYFGQELNELKQFEEDALVKVGSQGIEVLPAGHLLIRNICMVFDFYLRQQKEQRFSKVI